MNQDNLIKLQINKISFDCLNILLRVCEAELHCK